MTFLPEPDPAVLAFLFYRKFVFLQLLAVLAVLRLIAGQGIARWPALVTLLLAAAGVFTTIAPAFGLTTSAFYIRSAQIMAGGGGMAALLVPSAIFLICAILPQARWRWIDAVHIVALLALLGLWWWTS